MGQTRRRNTDGPKKIPPKVLNEKGKVQDDQIKKKNDESETAEGGQLQGKGPSSKIMNGRPQVCLVVLKLLGNYFFMYISS
jgi:hypothetical protein